MNTFTIKLGSFIAIVLLTIPTAAEAYRFVESSSVRISDNTYLLTHTYTAGFLNEDVMTPIIATQDFESEWMYPRVGFSIDGLSDRALQGAQVNALVLGNSAIVENQYKTLAGKRDTFTLIALVTLPRQGLGREDISLSVRTLPFSYTRDGEEKSGSYSIEN